MKNLNTMEHGEQDHKTHELSPFSYPFLDKKQVPVLSF